MIYADTGSEQAIAGLLRDPSNVFVAHSQGFAFHPAIRN